MNEKKIAITWFNKSNQQFAVSVDKSDGSDGKSSIKRKNGHSNLSLKMNQFNLFDQKQHFIIHLINPDNFFQDSSFIIESVLYPNHFVEIEEGTIVLNKKQKNPTKWQFIDGHLTCEKGKYYLFYDSKQSFSLKICAQKKFNDIRPNELTEFNNKILFHLCFCDGNSIPENISIVLYSPFFKKVISVIEYPMSYSTSIQMTKFDDHSKSQAWIYNSFEKSELCNSVYSSYFLTNDLKQHKIVLTRNGNEQCQSCIVYKDYKLVFNQSFSVIQYDESSKTFTAQKKGQKYLRSFIKTKQGNIANEKNCINHPSTFLIFLSNQKNLFEINHAWKKWYLYDYLSPRMNNSFNNWLLDNKTFIVFEKDKQLFKCTNEITFSDKSNNTMIYKLLSTNEYDEQTNFKHVDSRIFISNDPRISLSNVQLDDNSSITFSLEKKMKSIYDDKNNNYCKIGHYCLFDNYHDDKLDIDSQSSIYFTDYSYNYVPDEYWRSKKFFISNESNDIIFPSDEYSAMSIPSEEYEVKKEEEIIEEDELLNYINKKDIPSKLNDEFAGLIDGNQITISKENSNYCRKLGERLGITGLIDVANVVESFSLQYERLSKLSEIQQMLMAINSNNYKSLVNDFVSEIDNYDNNTICWIILSVSICKPLENDSLARFCNLLLQRKKDEFKKDFKKTIQRSFILPEPNFFFLKKIHDYCKDLFSHDEIKYLLQIKGNNTQNIIFFYKEFPELFVDKDNLEKIKKEQENFEEFIETGLNTNSFLKIIRNDDIDSFQQIVINKKVNLNQLIEINSLERIPILKNIPTLIQYAAFFGAVKIFKYLFLNKANLETKDHLNRMCYHYAIAGGNSEIIHTIHHEMTEKTYSTDMIACAIKYGQNDVFQWIMSNISPENLNQICKQDLILTSIISKNIGCLLNLIDYLYQANSKCVHYSAIFDNFEFLKLFLPFYIEDKESLICDVACSGNVDIMKYLLENCYKYNIQFDEYLRKLAIKIAVKFDKKEMFQFLSNKKDYSNKNFFYSICCESSSILQLFSTFDFSNILLNNVPLFISLLNQRNNALNVLMKSKYFNYKEISNCHSIFYYAVSNKMFDLAAKLYSQYSNFFDINENGLLVDNCEDPEIVEFLIGYPELCVNNKNSKHQTSIDILTSISSVDENERNKSISYLLKRPDIQINPTKIILNSLIYHYYDLFEIITNYCLEHKIKISDDIISQIIEKDNKYFLIHLIKNKLISIDQDNFYQICIKSQNIDIIHNILNDKIPQGQEMSALVYSINCNDKDYFHYLLDIITTDFKGINDFIPESNETLLTYSIKETENLFFLKELLSNKKIDINKRNKLGESPFLIAIKIGYDMTKLKLFISNKNIKIKFDDFKIAYNSFRPICTDIIYNIKHFDDDSQLLIDYIIEDKNNDLINNILNPPSIKYNKQKEEKKRKTETDYDEDYNEELNFNYMKEGDWKYFEKIKKTVFIPTIISYYLQNNNQDLLSTFHIIKSELKHDKIIQEKIKYYLCKSLFNNQFNESIIEYYKMFFVNQQNDDSNKLTLFGNVRTKEIAQKLIKMLNKQNYPTENIIMEVGGLNIIGKTAFYTSIEENNSSLFKYILNLSKEINTKLIKQKKKSSDLIICTKNKDGNNPFFAACLKDKKDTFLNPLIDKMIQLNSSDYFGKYGPLRAAFLKNDLELADLLISKGFIIDHYAFCQILKSKKYDLFKKKYLKNIKDFKFDLFMPLYLINDENELHKIFTKDMINFDFVPEGYEDEFDNYLLISSIRDSNEKLARLILNNCDKNKIMFHWQDINGKTALHYAIEKSLTNIVYLLIDEYTSAKSKLKCKFEINQTENNNDLIYPEKDVFSHFFIEDKEKQNPIHYLFKSLNIDYIVYFYKRASAFLKSTNKTNLIYNIFNAQILSYEKIENYVVNDYPLKSTNQNKTHLRKRKIVDSDYGSDVESDYVYYSYESSDIKVEETKSNFKSVIVKLEGQTLLTYSILSKNSKFIDNVLVKIPEIDPNRTNKNGEFPLLLAIQNDNLNILDSIINSSKNSKIPIDINKSGIVFSILEMTNNETINFCLKKLMKIKNFDFNQKKIVHNDKRSKEKIYLIEVILKKYSYLDKDTIKMFFESPKLSLNVRSNIAFDLIDKSIGNIVSYSSLFARIDDNIMKNARTKDDAQDTIATYAAKHYKNYAPLIALIFDKRVDFIESKNAEGKTAVDILNENENLDFVSIILNKKK